jgi:hypothetical protein
VRYSYRWTTSTDLEPADEDWTSSEVETIHLDPGATTVIPAPIFR